MYKLTFSFLRAAFIGLSAAVLFATTSSAVESDILALVKTPVQRIVVMDFGSLDTLDKLQQGGLVVGLPKENTPEYLSKYKAENYRNTGTMKEPDINLIRELKPDLIIISGRQAGSLLQLLEIAPTVQWKIDAKNYLDSYEQNIEKLAGLLEQQNVAELALKEVNEKVSAVRMKAEQSGKRAVVLIHNAGTLRPSNYSAYATIIHDVLGVERADSSQEPERPTPPQAPRGDTNQGEGVEANSRPVPSQVDINEYLSKYNPDIIFVVDRGAAIKQGALDKALWETDEIKATLAYRNKKIIVLTPDLWYLSGGGLESLSLQIDEVAAVLD